MMHTGHVRLTASCFFLTWILLGNASAQTDSPTSPSKVQVPNAEIETFLQKYVLAFNDRKLDQLTSFLSPTVRYREDSSGVQIDDAAAFIERLKTAIANEPTLSLQVQISEMHAAETSTVVVHGTTKLKAESVADEASVFTATLMKSGQDWKIESIVEQTPETTLQATAMEAIESLGWLEGTWQDSSPEQLLSKIEYLPGRQFLRRTITESASKRVLGFEIIGYDPTAHRVRSWTFFTDGSFGTGYWSGENDHWNLKMIQTLADGQTASGTYILRPHDKDTMMVQVVSREVDGEPMPSGNEMTMIRIETKTQDDQQTASGAD